MVKFPLKPSPATGPYDDEVFLDIANDTITSLSGQTVPNGTTLYDVQTTQQKISKMNISPDFYPIANQINMYLYYTGKAGSEYSSAMTMMDKPYSPVYNQDSQLSDAKLYDTAAKRSWEQIKFLYPDVTMYTLPGVDTKKPFSTNENSSWVFPYGTQIPSPLS